ncbi:MAG: glycosyltransferase family 39 protein [Polyangiaceae bacterium]
MGVITFGFAITGESNPGRLSGALPFLSMIAAVGIYKLYRKLLVQGPAALAAFWSGLFLMAALCTAVGVAPGSYWWRSWVRLKFLANLMPYHAVEILEGDLYSNAQINLPGARRVRSALERLQTQGDCFVHGDEPELTWMLKERPRARLIRPLTDDSRFGRAGTRRQAQRGHRAPFAFLLRDLSLDLRHAAGQLGNASRSLARSRGRPIRAPLGRRRLGDLARHVSISSLSVLMRNPFSKWSLVDRISYGVLGLTTLFMLVVGLWEIAAPFGAGHVAVLPARAIMADNMVTYGILYPVRAYSNQAPEISQAYAHHPWGTYYLFGFARLVFGRHEWAIRLVPVCLNVGMPSLLFFVANRLFDKASAAVAALAWAVLPITLAFAQFPAFETFSLAGMLAVTLSGLRFAETRSNRRLLELLAVTFLAANTDWIASLYVLATAATVLFLLVFWPQSSVPDAHLRPLLRGTLCTALVVLAVIGLYVFVFQQIGLYDDFLGSADHRAKGNDSPLTEVLQHRRYWLELMFTKLGFWIAGIGTLVSLGRLVVFRRMADLVPLLFTVVATIHYVHFKNGADVHIYWPLPFAGTIALSLAVLTRTLEDALVVWRTRRAARAELASDEPASTRRAGSDGSWRDEPASTRRAGSDGSWSDEPPKTRRAGSSALDSDEPAQTRRAGSDAPGGARRGVREGGASLWALGAVGAVALALFPDGLRALDYARDSGCRLNDDGQLNLQDYDKVAALEHFKRLVPKGERVMLQNSMWPNWSQDYALERPTIVRASLRGPNPTGTHRALFDSQVRPEHDALLGSIPAARGDWTVSVRQCSSRGPRRPRARLGSASSGMVSPLLRPSA